jgi:hypothetical protein
MTIFVGIFELYDHNGIVKRKLRGVEIDHNRQVLLWCWGGHSSLILKGNHLGFCKKRFAAT